MGCHELREKYGYFRRDYRRIAGKHRYPGKLLALAGLLDKLRLASGLFMAEAMDCGESERRVIVAGLGTAAVVLYDACEGFPMYPAYLPLGEKYYLLHCNADGSFRYEDFDTLEKIEAFIGERRALYRAEHGIE